MVQLLYGHRLATRRPARHARNPRLALITGGINRSIELPDHHPTSTAPCASDSQRLIDANAALAPPLNASRNACKVLYTAHLLSSRRIGSDVGKVSGYTSSAETHIVSLSGHLRGLDISFRSRAKRRRVSQSNCRTDVFTCGAEGSRRLRKHSGLLTCIRYFVCFSVSGPRRRRLRNALQSPRCDMNRLADMP